MSETVSLTNAKIDVCLGITPTDENITAYVTILNNLNKHLLELKLGNKQNTSEESTLIDINYLEKPLDALAHTIAFIASCNLVEDLEEKIKEEVISVKDQKTKSAEDKKQIRKKSISKKSPSPTKQTPETTKNSLEDDKQKLVLDQAIEQKPTSTDEDKKKIRAKKSPSPKKQIVEKSSEDKSNETTKVKATITEDSHTVKKEETSDNHVTTKSPSPTKECSIEEKPLKKNLAEKDKEKDKKERTTTTPEKSASNESKSIDNETKTDAEENKFLTKEKHHEDKQIQDQNTKQEITKLKDESAEKVKNVLENEEIKSTPASEEINNKPKKKLSTKKKSPSPPKALQKDVSKEKQDSVNHVDEKLDNAKSANKIDAKDNECVLKEKSKEKETVPADNKIDIAQNLEPKTIIESDSHPNALKKSKRKSLSSTKPEIPEEEKLKKDITDVKGGSPEDKKTIIEKTVNGAKINEELIKAETKPDLILDKNVKDKTKEEKPEKTELKKIKTKPEINSLLSDEPNNKQPKEPSTGTPLIQVKCENKTETNIPSEKLYMDNRETENLFKKPYFITHLKNLNASDGTRIKLTCGALGAEPLEVKWFKDGSPILNNEKYKIYSSDSLFTLEVLNTVVGDTAEYTCIVNNKFGYCTTKADLKILKGLETSAVPPTFTRSISDTYDVDKNELVLECRVRGQPAPTITWFKNRSKINSGEKYTIHYLADGICRLVVKHPEKSDTGLYLCKAENSQWQDQISHHVEFEGAEKIVVKHVPTGTGISSTARPYVAGVLTHNFVPSGGTWALQVEVKGSPMVVTWYKDKQALPKASTRHKTFTESGVYSLMFDNATDLDSGKYIFTASNLYGHIQTSAFLHVIDPFSIRGGKPPIFKSRPDKILSVKTGDDIVVSFRVSGEPKPKLTWMKGLQDISNDYRTMKETSDDYTRLTLKRAREEDMGTYCILAKNRYGCDRAFFTVMLRERATSPDMQSSENILQNIVNYHERRYFTDVPGRIFGEPIVTNSGRNWLSLSWNKPQHRGAAPVVGYRVDMWLPGGEGARWKELGVTASTNFDVFNLNQDGEYQFRITPRNRYGWGESVQTCPIAIEDCPEFPEFRQNLPAQVKGLIGSTLTLECEILQEDVLYIRWCFNGKEIKFSEENRYSTIFENNKCILEITDLQMSDAGCYMCEAANKAGRASTSTRLYVVNDPKILKADSDLKFLQVNVPTAEAPPQFLMRLRDRRVEVSFPVRLSCQITGFPIPQIEWSRDGRKISEDYRHKFLEENQFCTLEIDKTNLEDSGSYSVTAKNIFGSVSCHCKLIVDRGIRAYITPEFLNKIEGETINVVEGKELRLELRVKAYPSVTVLWYKNGVRLRPNRETRMSLTHDGRISLVLSKAKLEDAGVYTCIATNEVGRVENDVKIEILQKDDVTENNTTSSQRENIPYSKEPRFLKKPRSSDATEGDNVIICCEVIGDPKPEVIWLRDFLNPGYYKDSPHFHIIGEGPEYRLEIPDAKLDYTGTYTVIAKNCYGEAKAIISLQIKTRSIDHQSEFKAQKIFGKVQTIPKVLRELFDIRCCDGDSVTLGCEVEKSFSQDIRWEKCNKLVRLGEDFTSEFDGCIAKLVIKQVYPEDEGEYTCVVYNELGEARTSACLLVDVPEEKDNLLTEALSRPADTSTLNIQRSRSSQSVSPNTYSIRSPSRNRLHREEPPKFYAIPHNRIAEEGETVRFRCSIAGHPEPWTTWTKDGAPISASSRVTIREQGDLRILEISSVVSQDAGLYCVTLENSLGKTHATARLEVTSYRKYLSSALRTRSASPSPSYNKTFNGTDLNYGSYNRPERSTYSGLYTPNSRWCSDFVNIDQGKLLKKMSAEELDLIVLEETHEDSIPSFLKKLDSIIKVSESQFVQLEVKVAGVSPFKVAWLKDECFLPDCKDFEQSITDDGRVALNINDVFVQDSGFYTCEVSNDFGQISTTTYLYVDDGVNPPPIEFINTPSVTTVLCGDTARISAQVLVKNNAKVYFVWKIADAEIHSSDKYLVEVKDDVSILHIYDVTHLDSGQVSCSAYIASEEISQDSSQSAEENLFSCVDKENALCVTHITELKVITNSSFESECNDSGISDIMSFSERENVILDDDNKEKAACLLKGPKDTNALVGDRVLLKATYVGEPEPSITWNKAGKILQNDDRIWITSGDGITCLLLENITTHDSGKYGVRVHNEYGTHTLYASLSVEGPPDPPQGKPSVVAGVESATVTWSSSPYDGGSIITGFALEYSLTNSNVWTVAADNCHAFNYTVYGLKTDSLYIFRVRAINVHGSSLPSLVSDQIEIKKPNENATIVPSVVTFEPRELFQCKYQILEEIGKGRYGVVHRVVDNSTLSNFAAKIVRCRTLKDRKKIQEEIDIMNAIRHQKLLQLQAAYESQREMILLMEYISGGELFERVVADDFTLTERDCILFMRQICEGVAYMHQQSIVHLDLKPENIMCSTRTSHEIKIIDFGLAQKLNPNIPVRVLFGTAEFVSPEIINYEPISTNSDMWSIGIICYVLLSGLSPFMGDNDAETFANITRAEYDFNDEAFDTVSQNARDFIGALLVKQKENRLSAQECLKHTWLDPEKHQKTVILCKEKLKKFIIRRKWQENCKLRRMA